MNIELIKEILSNYNIEDLSELLGYKICDVIVKDVYDKDNNLVGYDEKIVLEIKVRD